ncbi:MAG: murein L,D-transpeptidase catalytic domain family protein [Chitinophagaceae bacterium]|nr:murein L,D-transpeptidase catalytic domain family protein [Chitinophagaceae bacterium]
MASKIIGVSIVLLIAISSFGYYLYHQPIIIGFEKTEQPVTIEKTESYKETLSRVRQKALLAKDYIKSHHFNKTTCFLIDMRLPSGKYRFFVYNLTSDTIEKEGLVTHGSGSVSETNELIFSNTPNSNCTSIGKYKIGNAYEGKFGLAYKLYGLDITNSNAFERFIVLHAFECVPDNEVAPQPICVSLGCPTVSTAFLQQLKTYIDKSFKPILLWIYY